MTMRLLGVDYGRRKIGLAISDGVIAEPLRVIRVEGADDGIKEVSNIAKKLDVSKVIIGISEGEMAQETKEFGRILENIIKIQVVFQDETLSTFTAQQLSISANIKRKKRKAMEDAYSASLILQSYIDDGYKKD